MPQIVVQQPNEWVDALKILIGFVLAIVLFYIQEKWRERSGKQRIRGYCLKELAYNVEVFTDLIDTTKRLTQEISVGTTSIYFDFEPDNILYKFTQDAHALGILFDNVSAQEIAKYNVELTFFSQNLKNYVVQRTTEYQNGQITPAEMIGTLQWVEDKAKDTIKSLKSIKQKLKQ